jgi:hypothetical protein
VSEDDAPDAKAEAKEPAKENEEKKPAEAGSAEPGEHGERGKKEDMVIPDGEAPDAVFQLLWKRVIEAWDDDKPHQLALSYAIEHEMLPEIAGRYRKLMDDPEKAARAKKKIDGIVVAATQMLMATKTPPREKVPWQWTAFAAAFMIVVISFLAYKVLLRR